MSSRYKFTAEEIAAIEEARKDNKDKRAEARLKALELRAKGKSSQEVSSMTGFHPGYITALVGKYRAKGLEGLSGNHYGGTSYTIEKLNKDSADGKHFRIEFGPITEYIVDGESIDTGSSKMDPIEFVLLNEKSDNGKQTAFITFEHTYSMYTCEAE